MQIFLLYTEAAEHGDGLGYLHKQPVLEVDFTIPVPAELLLPLSGGGGRKKKSRDAKERLLQPLQCSAVIHQDPSSLASEAGNTSAVAWRVSLQLAKLLLLQHRWPKFHPPLLDLERLSQASLLELGSGTGSESAAAAAVHAVHWPQ